jgi:hypothetical protein
MKTFPVRTAEDSPFSTIPMLTELISQAPSGMNIAQMRIRVRILEALEKATDSVTLEDADYAVLQQVVDSPQPLWTRADPAILKIVDDVLGAS